MDEEVGPEEEDVCSVLAQESNELSCILSRQSPEVIMMLCDMMPGDVRRSVDQLALASSSAAAPERIAAMLEYLRTANAAVCRNFLQSMCMLCENIPMHLESKFISVAGYPTNGVESSSHSLTAEKSPSPPSEQQASKRPRIDHWEHCSIAVKSLLLRRWKRLKERLVREVQLEDVWVSPRHMNRGRERPDQTPGPGDRGNRTPDSDGDYGSMESRVTLESFLQGSAGQVTVLLGQAGSGKTLLMSCLGQHWAQNLGPIPSSHLFVLLEFRQLNLLSRPLSLSELLFQYYLPPQADDSEKSAVLDYLLSNPEQSCWVLDGYDEFHSKITRIETQRNGELLDPQILRPVAELISGLLSRQILPGCTVVVTCRLRDVMDLEGMADNVGELLRWERHEIKEYVESYFVVKGHATNKALGEQAVDLLLSSRHLLAMSSLPALCNICCICLEHLLLEGRGGRRGSRERERSREREGGGRGGEGSGGGTQERTGEQGRGGGNEDITRDGTNVSPSSSPHIPTSLTQVYLTVLGAFLNRGGGRATDDRPKTTAPPQSPVSLLTTLSRYRSVVCALSQLAWRGLEESKILFKEQEISQDVLQFSIRTGLFSQVELRHEDGMLGPAYCFIHLTIQEFLAALRIMTSEDVTEAQLKKRFNLKSRWTTKSDRKTVFTDSLHLYVCGLASPLCREALVQLARGSGGPGALKLVQTRQALVLKLLKNLCGNNTLTGPKVLQLCHCVQETQDCQLAKEVVGTRPILEIRNIRLLPSDMDALAFVFGSVGDVGVGLDFGACSMEPECLDVLPRCHLHYLSFRGRKYDDKFAEKLSSILPKVTTLRKLEFCGACLTDLGAASLASALQKCPNITEINLSDNSLTDRGIRHIADIFTKLPGLSSVTLGRNNNSLGGVNYIIEKMTSCVNIQHIHADGMKDIRITLSQSSDVNSHKNNSAPAVRLLNQSWDKTKIQRLSRSLARCPALSVLDVSGGQWEVETLKSLAEFLPRLNITEKIIVNDSCLSVEGLVVLTALLSTCPAVVELNVRLESPDSVSIMFSGATDQPRQETSRKLCLSCCGLLPVDLGSVWRSLGPSSDLTLLDLSSNSLGNKGLRKLLDLLPRLSKIQEINASKNDISMEGVVMLAGALCSRRNLTEVHISDGGREQVILKFCPNKSDEEQQIKNFRVIHSSILPSDMTKLCRRLIQCPSHFELDLSHSSLTDEAIKNLLKVLPKMTSLQRLNVSHSDMSTDGALTLVSCLSDSQRVKSVELRPQSKSFIQFDTVKAEQASCRLTHFNLSSDNLERLVGILQQCQQLSDLDLSNNLLEDEGVNSFVNSLPRLQITSSVNLSSNSLTRQGALDVAGTLCTCDQVSAVEVSLGAEQRSLIRFGRDGSCDKTLSVRESRLEPDHLIRLAEILSNCPSLTKLELNNNWLQSQWVEDFVRLLSGHRKCDVSIEECWITSEAAVNLVCRCLDVNSNIHTIRVQQTTLHLSLMKSAELTSVSDDSSDPAPSMPTEKIGLVDCAVEGHHLAAMSSIVQRCPLLTELDLSLNSLDREGAEFLCSVLPSLPNLTTLSVGSKETYADAVVQLSVALLQSTGIQCLNLSGHVISDREAEILARVFLKLPRLRSVNLSRCRWTVTGGQELVKALGQCVNLEGLCLASVLLDEDSRVFLAHGLRKTNSIRRLNLNNVTMVMGSAEENGVQDLLDAMEGLTQMEEIELEGWRMADRGVEQLTRLLPTWTGLRKIRLSNNLISDQSGEKLLEALRSCNHLEELHLSSNSLGDLTAARMSLVLPSLTHLTVLDLSQNKLDDEGSVSLSKALVYMKNLTKINLTSTGTSELCAVAASLAHCHLIQDVSLGWNGCGDNVAVELANILPLCQKLTRLDLESNSVSVSGAEALVRALQSCPDLQLIRLWRNNISSSEAQRLSLKDRRLNFSST
ncbi:protein NLRC5 [Centroberyx affinis]|uniref:protein NLRC5 n=1 Tax=Centroberyx affinis TaxID=166261 RepID=UPI003A5C6F7D